MFTVNNNYYSDGEKANIVKTLTEDTVVYDNVGEEKGASGTPHKQGFVNMKKRKCLTGMKKIVGTSVYLEGARGSNEQNQ